MRTYRSFQPGAYVAVRLKDSTAGLAMVTRLVVHYGENGSSTVGKAGVGTSTGTRTDYGDTASSLADVILIDKTERRALPCRNSLISVFGCNTLAASVITAAFDGNVAKVLQQGIMLMSPEPSPNTNGTVVTTVIGGGESSSEGDLTQASGLAECRNPGDSLIAARAFLLAINNLASNGGDVARAEIGNGGGISAVVAALQQFELDRDVMEFGCAGLNNLAYLHENHVHMLECGVLATLVDILARESVSKDPRIQQWAFGVLHSIGANASCVPAQHPDADTWDCMGHGMAASVVQLVVQGMATCNNDGRLQE